MTSARALGKLRVVSSRARLALIVGLTLLVTGCTGGTETGNPPFAAALSYTGFSSEPERVGVQSAGSELTVRQAWLDLDGVSLSADGGCELTDAAALAVPGLGVGDHAAGAHVVTSFEAVPAAFCRLALPFVRAEAPDGAPQELAGNSLLLRGELADGTAISLASRSTEVVELEAKPGGFRLEPERAQLLLAFDFAAWFAGLELAAAERSGDAIRIDRENNPALLHAFELNLRRGVALYRDEGGDGVLDGSPPIAESR